MSFKDHLDVRFLPKGDKAKLLRAFSYKTIKVPQGFITDFASIPKAFWSIIGSPTGRYMRAAIIHDYCYHKKFLSRKQCDKTFLDGMKTSKVSAFKRWLMHKAVRIFAGGSWKK